ncbi:ABC transporter permease [Leucobacter luti]|uniref:ABC transporter permease n=1 Tax=Leucobacter luti TaxID=340320 RepID=UPI002867D123|nr:ABC transporter permease [Leucobacter luti]
MRRGQPHDSAIRCPRVREHRGAPARDVGSVRTAGARTRRSARSAPGRCFPTAVDRPSARHRRVRSRHRHTRGARRCNLGRHRPRGNGNRDRDRRPPRVRSGTRPSRRRLRAREALRSAVRPSHARDGAPVYCGARQRPHRPILAIGLATIPGYARMLRARVRGVARSGYVEWARLDDVAPLLVFTRHIAPNALWPLVSAATLGVGQAIVWVSALGFLGLGAEPPAPEWGAMLNAGRVYLTTAWWMTVGPGLAIVLTAAALTVLGRRCAGGEDLT